MKHTKRSRIIWNGRTLTVFGVLVAAAAITAGLLLSVTLHKAGTDGGGSPDEAAQRLQTQSAPESESAASSSVPPPEAIPQDGPEHADSDSERVTAYVASMTLHDKLCQMLIVTPDTLAGAANVASGELAVKAALEAYPVGGLIHFTQNITSGEQITLFNENAQSYAKTPLFIGIDEEGGTVSRLQFALGAHAVGSMLTYEKEGGDGAAANARTLADALKRYGFNTDFAPVADVWSNPANTVIGYRAYSRDFDTAARLVSAAVRGFKERNIVCAVKHFPGHGDTREDSHDGTAYVHKTLEELRAHEFKPFEAGIAAGADMVMVGHLIVPAVDELPATLSRKLVTGVLRGELDFDGVVITDSLAMGAVASRYSAEYVAVTAVKAGVDILLMPDDMEKTVAALTAAVADGEISERRIDESVTRILTLKAGHGMLTL